MRFFCVCLSLGMITFLSACAPALPPEQPEQIFAHTLIAAEQAAIQTEAYSVECKLEREAAEKLLAEAKQVLAQAKSSETSCKKLIKRIPRRRPKPKKKVEEKPEEKKEETKSNADGPLFSPSDAPL